MEKLNYYDSWMIRYAELSEEDKAKSRTHWLKCHLENVESGREDLIIFSRQILEKILIVDSGEYSRYIKAIT